MMVTFELAGKNLKKKQDTLPRAKAKALGKEGYVPRAMALALGTEGLTSDTDRLFAESSWTQLSTKEWGPQLSRLLWSPLVSALPRAVSTALGTGAGPTTNHGHPQTQLCREGQVSSRQIGHLCRELGSALSAQM
jgi:hypothetical protein